MLGNYLIPSDPLLYDCSATDNLFPPILARECVKKRHMTRSRSSIPHGVDDTVGSICCTDFGARNFTWSLLRCVLANDGMNTKELWHRLQSWQPKETSRRSTLSFPLLLHSDIQLTGLLVLIFKGISFTWRLTTKVSILMQFSEEWIERKTEFSPHLKLLLVQNLFLSYSLTYYSAYMSTPMLHLLLA